MKKSWLTTAAALSVAAGLLVCGAASAAAATRARVLPSKQAAVSAHGRVISATPSATTPSSPATAPAALEETPSTATAPTAPDAATPNTATVYVRHGGGHWLGKWNLQGLIAAGTIEQATADRITAYLEAKAAERLDVFDQMVADDALTQTQADALKAAALQNSAGRHGTRHGLRHLDLSTLVTDGALDQAAADRVTAWLGVRSDERQAEREKIDAMTDEERAAYFEAKKDELLGDMIDKGAITQEQADLLKEALPQKGHGGKHGHDRRHPPTPGGVTSDEQTTEGDATPAPGVSAVAL